VKPISGVSLNQAIEEWGEARAEKKKETARDYYNTDRSIPIGYNQKNDGVIQKNVDLDKKAYRRTIERSRYYMKYIEGLTK